MRACDGEVYSPGLIAVPPRPIVDGLSPAEESDPNFQARLEGGLKVLCLLCLFHSAKIIISLVRLSI